MGLFGRKQKDKASVDRDTSPAQRPARAGQDFLSPLWTDWPPAAPEQQAVVEPPAEPAEPPPPVVTAERRTPPPIPRSENPPPVLTGPAVVVSPMRKISDAPPVPAAERLHTLMARSDFRGARSIAEAILAEDPTDLDASAALETCVAQLRARIEERLGARDRILRQSLPDDWLANMALDPLVAFLLSRIDGVSSIDEIIDVCGMPPEQAMEALVELLEEGIVEAHPPPVRMRSSNPPR